jgi:hypothetical protein
MELGPRGFEPGRRNGCERHRECGEPECGAAGQSLDRARAGVLLLPALSSHEYGFGFMLIQYAPQYISGRLLRQCIETLSIYFNSKL